jgi:hypothetical protein
MIILTSAIFASLVPIAIAYAGENDSNKVTVNNQIQTTVSAIVTKIELNTTSLTLLKGKTSKLISDIYVTHPAVSLTTWSSSLKISTFT